MWRVLGDRVVTCSTDKLVGGGEPVTHLYGTAALLWLVLEQPLDIEAISRQLLADGAPSTDTEALVDAASNLELHGLVEVADR